MRTVNVLFPSITAALLALTPLQGVVAQLSTTVPIGSVVRWDEDGANRRGTVSEVDDGAGMLWVRQRGQEELTPVTLATPKLSMRTQKNRKLMVMGIGFASGFAFGMVLGDDQCRGTGWFDCLFTYTAEQKGAMLGVTFGLVGLLAGQREKWVGLVDPTGEAPSRLTAVIEPGRLGVRVAF